MTSRQRWVLASLFCLGEAVIILTHPAEARAVLRTVYDTLWSIAPKPEGYEPPHRF